MEATGVFVYQKDWDLSDSCANVCVYNLNVNNLTAAGVFSAFFQTTNVYNDKTDLIQKSWCILGI